MKTLISKIPAAAALVASLAACGTGGESTTAAMRDATPGRLAGAGASTLDERPRMACVETAAEEQIHQIGGWTDLQVQRVNSATALRRLLRIAPLAADAAAEPDRETLIRELRFSPQFLHFVVARTYEESIAIRPGRALKAGFTAPGSAEAARTLVDQCGDLYPDGMVKGMTAVVVLEIAAASAADFAAGMALPLDPVKISDYAATHDARLFRFGRGLAKPLVGTTFAQAVAEVTGLAPAPGQPLATLAVHYAPLAGLPGMEPVAALQTGARAEALARHLEVREAFAERDLWLNYILQNPGRFAAKVVAGALGPVDSVGYVKTARYDFDQVAPLLAAKINACRDLAKPCDTAPVSMPEFYAPVWDPAFVVPQ